MFIELGPYTYQESATFESPEWTTRTDNITGQTDQNVVLSTLNQTTMRTNNTEKFDDPLWVPNLASLNAWWNLNNQDSWKQYMTVLYQVVNMGLGQTGQDSWIFPDMQTKYFPNATAMGQNLFFSDQMPN